MECKALRRSPVLPPTIIETPQRPRSKPNLNTARSMPMRPIPAAPEGFRQREPLLPARFNSREEPMQNLCILTKPRQREGPRRKSASAGGVARRWILGGARSGFGWKNRRGNWGGSKSQFPRGEQCFGKASRVLNPRLFAAQIVFVLHRTPHNVN